jgi:uncharacterized membrane protein YfcA
MTEQTIMTYLLFAAAMLGAGAVGGLLAGLLGVGGGIVIVPVLYQLFTLLDIDSAIRMHLAVGTSLATIVVTATVSTRAHLRRGAVDIALLRSWAPWIILGVIVGVLLFRSADSSALALVFATVALLVAGYMTIGKEGEHYLADRLPTGAPRYASGVVIGTLSSMMGIGGGTLAVPILSLCRYPIRNAVATAAAIGLLIAIPGTIGALASGIDVPNRPPFSIGYVNVLGFLLLVPMTSALAPIGARIAHSINGRYLRYAFGLFLLVTAVNMFASSL